MTETQESKTHYEQQREEHGELMDEFVRRLRDSGLSVEPPTVGLLAIDEATFVRAASHWNFGDEVGLMFDFQEGAVLCPRGPYDSEGRVVRAKKFRVKTDKTWEKLVGHVHALVDLYRQSNLRSQARGRASRNRVEFVREMREKYPMAGCLLSTDHDGFKIVSPLQTDTELIRVMLEAAEEYLSRG